MGNPERQLGHEFSKEEKERLAFLEHRVEKGLGSPEDSPSEGREFTLHKEVPEWEKIDPAWENIPLEKREELRRFLKEIAQEARIPQEAADIPKQRRFEGIRSLFSREKREPVSVVPTGSAREILYRVLQKKYPSWNIKIAEKKPKTLEERVRNNREVRVAAGQRQECMRALETLLEHPVANLLYTGVLNRPDLADLLDQVAERERAGQLSEGAVKRIIATSYRQSLDVMEYAMRKAGLEASFSVLPIHYEMESRLQDLQAEPYSAQELEALFQQIIDEKLEKAS